MSGEGKVGREMVKLVLGERPEDGTNEDTSSTFVCIMLQRAGSEGVTRTMQLTVPVGRAYSTGKLT